jgi:SAM-dependent methyltransferase
LTSFYLSLAIGGALGGLFNAIVAPVIFDSLLEYPIVLVCASLLVSRSTQTSARWAIRDMMAPLLVVAVGLLAPVAERIGWPDGQSANAGRILLAVAALICFAAGSRPLRFALCVSALFLANAVPVLGSETMLFSDRSFFGVSRVADDSERRLHTFTHGSTVHGFQSMDADRRLQPAGYYDESGPLGAVFAPGPAAGADVAVIGLGTGTMACYAEPGQSWTFYELDPTVARVARDERLFTYLRDCPGSYDIVVGDGRLNLELAPPGRFALITIDAFSSDAIPMHLLTTEAVDVYKDKLASDGVLLFHISNRYLDLRGVLSRLASESGLVAYVGEDTELDDDDRAQFRSPSVWVAMAQRDATLDGLGTDSLWAPLRPIENAPLWTDDYSNILSVLRAN